MQLIKYKNTGEELFEIITVDYRMNGSKCNYPLNINFRKKKTAPSLLGSGIYAITFNDFVIYIGQYRPYNGRDLLNLRWKKHLATITNRGYDVGFGNKNRANTIVGENSEFNKYLNDKENSWRFTDTGTVTSIERFSFANENKTFFNDKNLKNSLKNFKFYFYKIKSESIPENEKIKEYPELATILERNLIKIINPRCNLTRNAQLKSIKIEEFEEELNKLDF